MYVDGLLQSFTLLTKKPNAVFELRGIPIPVLLFFDILCRAAFALDTYPLLLWSKPFDDLY